MCKSTIARATTGTRGATNDQVKPVTLVFFINPRFFHSFCVNKLIHARTHTNCTTTSTIRFTKQHNLGPHIPAQHISHHNLRPNYTRWARDECLQTQPYKWNEDDGFQTFTYCVQERRNTTSPLITPWTHVSNSTNSNTSKRSHASLTPKNLFTLHQKLSAKRSPRVSQDNSHVLIKTKYRRRLASRITSQFREEWTLHSKTNTPHPF